MSNEVQAATSYGVTLSWEHGPHGSIGSPFIDRRKGRVLMYNRSTAEDIERSYPFQLQASTNFRRTVKLNNDPLLQPVHDYRTVPDSLYFYWQVDHRASPINGWRIALPTRYGELDPHFPAVLRGSHGQIVFVSINELIPFLDGRAIALHPGRVSKSHFASLDPEEERRVDSLDFKFTAAVEDRLSPDDLQQLAERVMLANVHRADSAFAELQNRADDDPALFTDPFYGAFGLGYRDGIVFAMQRGYCVYRKQAERLSVETLLRLAQEPEAQPGLEVIERDVIIRDRDGQRIVVANRKSRSGERMTFSCPEPIDTLANIRRDLVLQAVAPLIR